MQNKKSKFYFLFLILSILFAVQSGLSQNDSSGWGGPLMTMDEWTTFTSQSQSGARSAAVTNQTETEVTPEIAAQAKALQNDPVRIFEFVRNHIRYIPYHGLWKGALATYMTKEGNDLDQCSLLIALLKAADQNTQQTRFENAKYIEGSLVYSNTYLSNFTGFNESLLTTQPGLASLIITRFEPEFPDSVVVRRYWVEVTIDGITYSLDPSFVTYQEIAGLDDSEIKSAMQYDRVNFMSDALVGATASSHSLTNVNETNIVSAFIQHSTDFVNHVRNNHANKTIGEIIGGRKVVKQTYANLPVELPFANYKRIENDFTTVPPTHLLSYTVKHTNIDEVSLDAFEITGKRFTLYHDQNGAPQYFIDGQLLATGDNTNIDQGYTLTTVVKLPGTSSTVSASYNVKGYRTYAIMFDPGMISSEIIKRHNQELTKALNAGVSNTSEEILGGTLNLVALNYANQVRKSANLAGTFANVEGTVFLGGIVAQEESYFVDFGLNLSRADQTDGDLDKMNSFSLTNAFFHSALEHGTLQQSQGIEHTAASTSKLIQINNSTTIDKTTFRTDALNWSTIEPQLIGYSQSEKDNIFSEYIDQGFSVIIPKNGDLSLPEWTWSGNGYYTLKESSFGLIKSISYLISGGYAGGYAGTTGLFDSENINNETSINFDSLPDVNITRTLSDEPVDLFTGNYILDNSDLSVGRAEPEGLSLARHYDSGDRAADGPFGYGWTHNYEIMASVHGDGISGLGGSQAIDAASLITYSIIVTDLISDGYTLEDIVISSIAANWAMDQLIDNAVTLTIGSRSMKFIKLPDGTYNPPPGVTETLVMENGKFELHGRFGTVMKFNANNQIESWSDADGNTMNFAYTNDTLSTVTDMYNRQLTYTYIGDHITSISDGTGRSVSYQYSPEGDLTGYTDPENKTWTYVYDSSHQITSIKDPLQQTTIQNVYNAIGKVDKQISATGHTWNFYIAGDHSIEENPDDGKMTYFFDELGRQIGRKNQLGHNYTTIFDGQNHIIKTIDPRGAETLFNYDGDNNLITTTNARGFVTTNTYDPNNHRLIATQDHDGNITAFVYDAEHHLTKITDALSNETVNLYFPDGKLQKTTDKNNNETIYTYDPWGNVKTISRTDSGVITYTYNVRGDRISVVDGRSNETTFQYDKRRLLTAIIDPPIGASAVIYTSTNSYNAIGKLDYEIDRNGNKTSYTYHPNYKIHKIIYPDDTPGTDTDNPTVTHLYDKRDNIEFVTDPRDNQTTNVYDAANRVIEIIDALVHKTYFTYDDAGNTISIKNHLNEERLLGYDLLGQNTSVTDELGNTSTTHYKFSGQIWWTRNALGKSTYFGYDALHRNTYISHPNGSQEIFRYDNEGNLTEFENAQGNIMTFVYDGSNRVIERIDSLQNKEQLFYDDAGNLEIRIDPLNRITGYEFDEVNRLTTVLYPVETIDYTYYDGNGNLRTMIDADGTTFYYYDERNRLTSVNDHNGSSVSYEYDAAGNREKVIYPGSFVVNYTYDAVNRLNTVNWDTNKTTSYTYDDADRLINTHYPNTVTGTMTPDAAGQIADFNYKTGAATPFVNRVITRNELGFKTADDFVTGISPVNTNFHLQDRNHDASDRLERVNSDSIDDSTSTNTIYTYNSNGNLIDGGGKDFTYDYEDRLTSYQDSGDQIQFTYDGQGNRTKRTENGLVRQHILDHGAALSNVLMEKDTSGNVVRYYIWGNGLIAQVEANGTTHYVHADEQGSTIALTDASGSVTDQIAYSPYGEILNSTGTTDIPYLYIGGFGVFNEGHNLYHMKARYYDSQLKRFLTKDPIGLDGGMNLYAYADSNPLFFIDPFGLESTINSTSERFNEFGSFAGNTAAAGLIIAGASIIIPDPSDAVIQPVVAGGTALRVAGGFLSIVAIPEIIETGTDIIQDIDDLISRAKDSSKAERHGDSGRALEKAQKKIENLGRQLESTTGREARKIRQKIKNIREAAQRKAKGETHSR